MSEKNTEGKINKEDAIVILDRTIGFVNNCDSKASIILGVFGVIFTLIFTTDGIVNIRRIVDKVTAVGNVSVCSMLYLFGWLASLIVIVLGLCKIISVLTARIDCSHMEQEQLDTDSKIYFGDIAKNETYRKYKGKLLSLNSERFLNDIGSQIYINSVICSNKFKKYNESLLLTTIGFTCFLLLWIVGYAILL